MISQRKNSVNPEAVDESPSPSYNNRIAINVGLDNNYANSASSTDSAQSSQYRLYPKRWFMLFIVCILNVSNALLWITFSAVANLTNAFYCKENTSCGAADWLSLVFMIVAIPVGFVAMWSVDSFGLRTGIWLGTWVNVVGAALRVVSSVANIPDETRFPIVLTGQIIASVAQPFIMYLPTKLASQWFPENHRALANTLGSMSNPLGIMLAMLISPHIVYDLNQVQHQMLVMNGVMFAPAALTAILVTFGVWSDKPPTPPTGSAANVHEPFWLGFKKVFRNKAFMVLVLCLGGGMGLFNAAYTLLEQILCPKGYTNSFSGICGALLIGGGLVGSVISGIIVDKTKWFEEVAKVCFSFAAIAVCAFAVVSLHTDFSVPIAILCTLFGAFGFSIYPIGLEMGVECTYPVAEATSAGLIIISGQLQGIIYVILMSSLTREPSAADNATQTCTAGNPNDTSIHVYSWMVPNLIFCGIACLLAGIFVLFFWPKYKRMAAEHQMKIQAKKLQENGGTVGNGVSANNPNHQHVPSTGGSVVTVVTVD